MARRRRNLCSLIALALFAFLGITLFRATPLLKFSTRKRRTSQELLIRLNRRPQSTPLNRSTFFDELYEYADAFPNTPREGNLYQTIMRTIEQPWRQNGYNTRYFKLVFEEGTNMSTYDHMMLTKRNTHIGSNITTVNRDNYTIATKQLVNLLPEKSLLPLPPYKTCSVVGSSGILLGSGCGHKIDESDVVFRFNLAPTVGFEADVGTKTNVTSMNPSMHILSEWTDPFAPWGSFRSTECYRAEIKSEYGIKTYYIRTGNLRTPEDIAKFHAYLNKTEGIVWTSTFASGVKNYTNESLRAIEIGRKGHHTNLQFVFEDPSHFRAFKEFWKDHGVNKWSSTGFYFINSALAMCEHVNVYGFWPFNKYVDGRKLSYHYHDAVPLKKGHDMPFEFKLVVSMHHYGLLKLQSGSCRTDELRPTEKRQT